MLVLVVAAAFDVAKRRVPNALILSGLAVSLGFAGLSGPTGVGRMLAGIGVAMLVLLPVYANGLMGAGDVKLISLVGSFLGVHHLLWAMLCIFIAGGFLTAFYMFRTRMALNVPGVPYAVAILAGVASYLAVTP
jgi:prepilin peptidase CpaA